MQVKWKDFLRKLDVVVDGDINQMYTCPLHSSKIHTLKVYHNPVTHSCVFKCIHNDCGFYGDAVQLLAKYFHTDIEVALAKFLEEDFAETLQVPMAEQQIDEYLDAERGQGALIDYVARCQEYLRKSDYGAVLRYNLRYIGLSDRIELLPEELGAVCQDNIPILLGELHRKEYIKKHHLLIPYYFEDKLTFVETQEVRKDGTVGELKRHEIIPGGYGIFLHNYVRDNPNKWLCVTPNPLTACDMVRVYKLSSAKVPNIICAKKLPLPHSCVDNNICYVDLNNSALPLEYALKAYTAKQTVQGFDKDISARISNKTLLNYHDISTILSHVATRSTRIQVWLANKIKDLADKGLRSEIINGLKQVELSPEKREQLVDELYKNGTHTDIITLVRNSMPTGIAEVQLGNGNCLSIEDGGMYGIYTGGKRFKLLNGALQVNAKILTQKGPLRYACTFKAQTGESVNIMLNETDCSRAEYLQRALNRETIRAGYAHAAYIAVYEEARKFKWTDIMSKLSEGKPCYNEVDVLGVNTQLEVHFPSVMLDVAGRKVGTQGRIYNMQEDVFNHYAALNTSMSQEKAVSTISSLFKNMNDIYVSAFILGLCHIIYQVATQYYIRKKHDRENNIRTHLCYIEPVEGMWWGVLNNLHTMLSNCTMVPALPGNVTKHLRELTPLGTLPFICELPAIPAKNVPRLLQDSPVNLITRVDSDTAALLNNHPCVSMVIPPNVDASESEFAKLNYEDLYKLQGALPQFINYLLNITIAHEVVITYRDPQLLPAQSIYNWICAVLDIKRHALADTMLQKYYVLETLYSLQNLLRIVGKLCYDGNTLVPSIYGAKLITRTPCDADFSDDSHPPAAYILPEIVHLSKRVMTRIIRQKHMDYYTIELVDIALKQAGYLVKRKDIPRNKHISKEFYWTIPREVWDTKVRQTQITLIETVTPGNLITLNKLTA